MIMCYYYFWQDVLMFVILPASSVQNGRDSLRVCAPPSLRPPSAMASKQTIC